MRSKHTIDLRAKRPGRPHPLPIFAGEKRSSPLRARRRRMRLYVIVAILTVCGLLVFGVHYLSYRPFLRITTIEIQGTAEIPSNAVSDYIRGKLQNESFRFFPRDSIFFYPREEIAENVHAAFPRIESLQLKRESAWSTILAATIVERLPYARWCSDAADCFVLDRGGIIFADATSTIAVPATAYIFRGSLGTADPIGKTFAQSHMAGLITLLDELEKAGFVAKSVRVEPAEVGGAQDFYITLLRGYGLKASFGASPYDLVRNLELVLKSDALVGRELSLEYIDLRFGNRVYYKFKGAAQTEATSE